MFFCAGSLKRLIEAREQLVSGGMVLTQFVKELPVLPGCNFGVVRAIPGVGREPQNYQLREVIDLGFCAPLFVVVAAHAFVPKYTKADSSSWSIAISTAHFATSNNRSLSTLSAMLSCTRAANCSCVTLEIIGMGRF